MENTFRARRSCLAVPGSNPKMIDKARGLASDQVFLDLEDACAPDEKIAARQTIVNEINAGGWGEKTVVVRVNDVTTKWAYRDVVEVVEQCGRALDCVMLPKVRSSYDVFWLDALLSQIEEACEFPAGEIGIEAQIEDSEGLINVDAIAASSPRLKTIIFGPGDFMASINMKSLAVGEQPPGYDVGDAFHYPLMRILMAARANGLQAIDGPYARIKDTDGFRQVARRSASLGFDGKWVLHPDQIEAANDCYSPTQEDFDRASQVVDAYAFYTSDAGGRRGAVMLGDEMIDEASRKMAEVIVQKGSAAGLQTTVEWKPVSS